MNRDEQIKETFKLMNFVDFDKQEETFIEEYQHIFNKSIVNENEVQNAKKEITIRLLNYIYSGKWELSNQILGEILDESAKKAFGLATIETEINEQLNRDEIGSDIVLAVDTNRDEDSQINDLIDNIKENWKTIFSAHEDYLKELNSFEKIIVYEAPPYRKNQSDVLNYLLCKNATGPYIRAIKQLDESKSISKILTTCKILLFDLLMLPIPISSSLRRKWATEQNFQIDGFALPVFLFQMNIEYFKKTFDIQDSTVFKQMSLAIGTPHLTSLPIYIYYSQLTEREEYPNLVIENNINTRTIKELEGKVIPLFKSSFVNSSNNPDGDLLKLALGCFD
jgi:hypothetical protein